MWLAIFLYIISYFIGMTAQTRNQYDYFRFDDIWQPKIGYSAGYNWFYPISNGFYWALYTLTSLFVLICTCIGLGYYVKKQSMFNGDCIEDIITFVLGSIAMTFMCTFVYFFLIYFSFGMIMEDSLFSILLGFFVMLFCNLMMGHITKHFDKFVKENPNT